MVSEVSPLATRRSILIKAPPERVWQEFETFERMRAWFGTGHVLTRYEPGEGGWVEFNAGFFEGRELRFGGRIAVFEPPRELTFENQWFDHPWSAPLLLTIRLTPMLGGTLVELIVHGYERLGEEAAELHRGHESGWTIRQLEALRQVVEA